MKKMLAIVMTFAVLFGIFSVAFAAENGAVDSIESVQEAPEGYTAIRTAEDLNNIRNDLAGKYILMNDIDLSVYENWVPIGNAETPFTGELDGNGYVIENMKINEVSETTENYIGLFGLSENSVFDNLTICNINVNVSDTTNTSKTIHAGAISGKVSGLDFVKIRNSCATGQIIINGFKNVFVGGLIGSALLDGVVLKSSNYTNISVCSNTDTENIYAAGLVAKPHSIPEYYNESLFAIRESCNFGTIFINNSLYADNSNIFVAGISTYLLSGNDLKNCYNRGDITITNSTGVITACGIVCNAKSRIEKSYNSGRITTNNNLENLVCSLASIEEPDIYFPEGPVSSQDYTVYDCYYLKNDVPGCIQNFEGNLILYKNIFELTENEFKKQESFVGFDFDEVWTMEENGYPVLQNQPIINVKEDVELEIGDTFELPDYESVKSADESIAKANENKLVALSAGTTTITLTHTYGYYTEYTVIVAEEETTTELTTEETTEPTTETTTEKVEVSTTIPEPFTTEKEETMQSTTAPVTEPETQPSTVPEPTTEPAIEPTTATEETTTEPSDDEKCPLEDCQLIKFLKQFFNFVCEILCEIVSRIV